ncbi:hypothetical protein [Cohnella sp. AR92]|uniref:hypothetical protein n=1 Tax=Cohnella sp. AR92 TaxID=648716 RepID=UPI000F8F6D93|nr:hypothetical protein [Cohnella sp. AR92]RUS42282.1 hypothetical protein ELR57_27095 [Cohnella sp. AR92]
MELELIVRVTDHAYDQYCHRVGFIGRAELRNLMTSEIAGGNYHKEEQFLLVDGVWWVQEGDDNTMLLITCYGRSNFDIPKAIKWARRNNDRISL